MANKNVFSVSTDGCNLQEKIVKILLSFPANRIPLVDAIYTLSLDTFTSDYI